MPTPRVSSSEVANDFDFQIPAVIDVDIAFMVLNTGVCNQLLDEFRRLRGRGVRFSHEEG